MQGAQGRPGRPVAIFDGRAQRALCNPPGAYWEAPGGTKHSRGIAVVRENAPFAWRSKGFRSDNAADGHSWTGS